MELADRTGSIPAKVWADSPAMHGDFEAHHYVLFKGGVKLFRDALQISLDTCRQVNESDREHGFDESKLIPSTEEDIDVLWDRLTALYETVEDPLLHRLAAETLELHGERLKVHPAAKSIHHAYLGGLLEHVLSMAELATVVAGHYVELDRDLILLGVLFHDLGKTRELGAMPVNDYTREGRLVGHVVIGRDLVVERCRAIPGFPQEVQLHLEHLVLSHQGKREFASPVEPMTAEALALHFIDDLDSKLAQLRAAASTGATMDFLRPLGRFFYFGKLAPEGGEVPEAEPAAEALQEVRASEPAEDTSAKSDGADSNAPPDAEAAGPQDAAEAEDRAQSLLFDG